MMPRLCFVAISAQWLHARWQLPQQKQMLLRWWSQVTCLSFSSFLLSQALPTCTLTFPRQPSCMSAIRTLSEGTWMSPLSFFMGWTEWAPSSQVGCISRLFWLCGTKDCFYERRTKPLESLKKLRLKYIEKYMYCQYIAYHTVLQN